MMAERSGALSSDFYPPSVLSLSTELGKIAQIVVVGGRGSSRAREAASSEVGKARQEPRPPQFVHRSGYSENVLELPKVSFIWRCSMTLKRILNVVFLA